jgi:hypothetical protein
MIVSTIAALALAAAGATSPFSHFVHAHPAIKDARVTIVLRNSSPVFQDIKIGEQVYTVGAQRTVLIKAPVGTVVYATGHTGSLHSGDKVVEITPGASKTSIVLQ